MPLPAALLSRLQKRGIIKKVEQEIEEEVIAEDYDDNEKSINDSQKNGVEDENNNFSQLKEPWIGCPNKWNIYHDCTKFCKEKWGNGKEQISPHTDRKRQYMLKKYPLPEGWQEVYDPGIGRHYYWNIKTDEVSWLSPTHPQCKISLSADKLRALIKENFLEPMDEDQSESEEESEDEENENTRDERKDRHHRKEFYNKKGRDRGKSRKNDLDPMDPAAYSEAPRGTWSSGLDRKGEAKTGADTTASGPLYQMRPYPSPGAVLRLNAELRSKSTSDNDET